MSLLGEAALRGVRTVNAVSRFGERRGIDWLTYNPAVMLQFHLYARRDAPGVVAGLREVFPHARRIADVGSGSGAFAAEAQRQGLDAIGCERGRSGRLLSRFQRVRAVPFELAHEPPAMLPPGVQLAYCFEVAEHVPPALSDTLVAFLAATAPIVVLSAAKPGQPGVGHINLQPPEAWHARFAERGLEHREEESDRLRRACARHGVPSPWMLSNPVVYRSDG